MTALRIAFLAGFAVACTQGANKPTPATSAGTAGIAAGGFGGEMTAPAGGFGGEMTSVAGSGGAPLGGAAGSPSAGAAGQGGTGGASGGFGGLGGQAGEGGAGGTMDVDGGSVDAGPFGIPEPPTPSTGCARAADQALGTYVRKTVSNSQRVYDLYIPQGYNPQTPYRLIFLGHGCDGSIPYPPLPDATEGNAIVVALRSVSSQNSGMLYGGGCFDTGPGSNSLTELPYFDQVLADVSASYCVDTSRVFMAGHSSGSWLTNLLGCARAGVIRGQGNSAGGLPVVPDCTGPIAAMMCHDMQDDQNAFIEGEKARDRILAINGCSTETKPYDWDGDPATPSVCVMYQGCKPGYPVVWCPTMGKGHSDQIPMTTVGLWRFWKQF